MGGWTVATTASVTEAERMVATRLIVSAAGLGRNLEFKRAVEIARLLDEEDDEEIPT